MTSTDRILQQLGSDSSELTPELFAEAAKNPEVITKLVTLVKRAAEKPGSFSKRETNLVSWAGYVFAENGSPELIAPLLALGELKEDDARKFTGAYADYDLPVVFLRLGGAEVGTKFGALIQTYQGAPEVRVAPILAAGAAWAHGLISREAATAPLREELERMANDSYAEAQDDEWFDALLDAALGLNPGDLEDELSALGEYWGLEDDWDGEFVEASREAEEDTKARLRDMFPMFTTAMQFIERWDAIDAEDGE
jgi:hypothetical protein